MSSFSKIVFGPSCPAALRSVVHHAERLANAALEAQTELRRTLPLVPRDAGAREAWLIGRASEIEAYVFDVMDDWRRCAITSNAATDAVSKYLDAVHRGMTRVTGGARPPCCSIDDVVTRDSPPPAERYAASGDGGASTLALWRS